MPLFRLLRPLPGYRPHRALSAGTSPNARAPRHAPSWRAWLPRLAQFMLPNLCVLCGTASPTTFCATCDATFWNEPRLRCTVCAAPLGGWRHAATGYRCQECQRTPPSFDATLALADYRAPLDSLVRDLKFRAQLALANEFAARLARAAGDTLNFVNTIDSDDYLFSNSIDNRIDNHDEGSDLNFVINPAINSARHSTDMPDIIAPVPLSRKRLIERGYNQAWQIAKPLAKALHVKADASLIRRVGHTAPQSRLNRRARRRNVDHAFALTRPVRGLHIAIVDDVMTSGATLDALARTLKTAGARRVTNFVALRTPPA